MAMNERFACKGYQAWTSRPDALARFEPTRRGVLAALGLGTVSWLGARSAFCQLVVNPARVEQPTLVVVFLRGGMDGLERPVGMFGSGQALGTTALLQQPAALSCQALSSGRLCEVSVAAVGLQGLVNADFLHGLAMTYAQTNARLADWARIVRIRGVAGQLAGALLQLSTLQRSTLVRLPSHTVLAGLLATTRETIARTLRQLDQQQCVVRHDRWHCEIRRAQLLALASGAGASQPRASL
ncbi:MAG: Crp/Fnr family transcriptional regulator [Burkholderiaceae bacterium]|nr:MAG: Crp/Fnr family transcriptional regulator [Burkholderiaceae bacterium]